MAYNGSIELISGIKQKNNGEFPLVDASAVRVTDEKRLDAALNEKAEAADVIPKPAVDGTEGQHLQIDANGNPAWVNPGTPTDTQVDDAVTAWLNAHPEATTTVQDGAVSRAKLDADLKAKTDAVLTLQSNSLQYRGILNPSADPPVTPDTVTEIGYWTCPSSNASAIFGTIYSGVFFNLRQPPYDFLQMFIDVKGNVLCRYQKSGSFVNLYNRQITFVPQFPMEKSVSGGLITITIPAGSYTLPGYSTRNDILAQDVEISQTNAAAWQFAVYNVVGKSFRVISVNDSLSSDDVVLFAFLGDEAYNVSVAEAKFPTDLSDEVAELQDATAALESATGLLQSNSLQYRGFLNPSADPPVTPDTVTEIGYWTCGSSNASAIFGTIYSGVFFNLRQPPYDFLQMFIDVKGNVLCRYQKSGSFVNLYTHHRQTRFVPRYPLEKTVTNNLISVTIKAGYYAVPEHTLRVDTLSSDVTISQTNAGTYQYGVYNLSTKAFRLAERTETLGQDDLVLFAFYGSDLLNVAVEPSKFPEKETRPAFKPINDFFAGMFNRTGTPFKIVLGGDSITHGNGGTGYRQDGETIIGNYKRNPHGYCWANLFRDYIQDNYNAVVVNNAVTGTYAWWWDQNKATLIPSDADLFILTLGTNNRIKAEGRNGTTRSEQIANYYTQMKSIIEYCNSINVPILLCSSIPATAANENAESEGVPLYPSHMYDFNGVLQRLASEYNMAYFNLYDAMYYYVRDNNLDYSTMLPDTLHPNDSTYRLMFYLYLRGFNLAPSYVPVELPQT